MNSVDKHNLEIMKTAKGYNLWVFSKLKPYLGSQILDVGAGIGSFTGMLPRGKSTAIDIDKFYIKKLQKKFGTNAGFGDIEKGKYFFGNKKFDTIICLNVLEHIKDYRLALKNICKLLKGNGKFIATVPAHKWAYGTMDKYLDHFRRYEKNELIKKCKAAKLEPIIVRRLNFFGLMGWFVNGKLLRRDIIHKVQLTIFEKLVLALVSFEKIIEPPLGLSLFLVAQKK